MPVNVVIKSDVFHIVHYHFLNAHSSMVSLAVQWLGLHAFTAEGLGSTPGWRTKIPQATQCMAKKKKAMKLIHG